MSETLRYEGKAKILYPVSSLSHPIDYPKESWVQQFKDDVTAFNREKFDVQKGKGAYNQQISSRCFAFLQLCGFDTHYLGSLDDTRQVIRRLEMLKLECVVRRIAAGSLVKRLGVPKGTKLHPMMFEIFLKNDALGDPHMGAVHVPWVTSGISASALHRLELLSFGIFGCLAHLFAACELTVVDGKLEFGWWNNTLVLGDEISPDTLRLWAADGQNFDKDVFRERSESVVAYYAEVLRRIESVSVEHLANELRAGVACAPYEITCMVTPKIGVLDPEGQAAKDVLLSETGIASIQAGRMFVLKYEHILTGSHIAQLDRLAAGMFANPLIQDCDLSIWRN